MDPNDPYSLLLSKIRPLEPEHASKIFGYLLLQDLGKEDLMRLALGPDTLLQSVCEKAKTKLGLSSNTVSTSTPLNPNLSSSPFHNGSSLAGSSSVGNGVGDASRSYDILDEQELGDYLSFLNESSAKNEEVADPFGSSANNGDAHLHRRSFSASDASFGPDDPGFGSGYRFSGSGHDFDGRGSLGSPSMIDYVRLQQQEEMMKMKVAHQRRMAAAHFMSAGVSPLPHDKGLNLNLHTRNAHRPRLGQFGEEGFLYGRHEREDFMGDRYSSAARQIYLTFPADSSFTDEDVSNYFGNFGPVQDVRIPYQQKRMFGFVTFVHAETVRMILARGNPHFICDSRVLVKPYKEKGKILEKRQQQLHQQMERGNFSPGSSPSGINSTDLFECHFGPRMFSNRQEMRRREADQVDLQQAIELQRRRFVNLQLPNLENESIRHHQRSFTVGSPGHFPVRINQSTPFPSENISEEIFEDNYETWDKEPQLGSNSASQNDTYHNRSEEPGYNGGTYDADKGETHQPESEKEKCSPLSDTERNKPSSSVHSE